MNKKFYKPDLRDWRGNVVTEALTPQKIQNRNRIAQFEHFKV
jgi:hypothetical protein